MGKKHLDKNEKAFLCALYAADHERDGWLAHWAPSLRLDDYGADLLAQTYEGSYEVMKRLRQRKLVDSEPGRLSHHLGVGMNDAGEEALIDAGIDLEKLKQDA